MKKLNSPPYASLELFDESVASLADPDLRAKFVSNRAAVEARINDFNAATVTRTWCNLPRTGIGNPGAIVAGSLTKGELVYLYDAGVVRSSGRSRDIYDKIKLAARDECPYCGGIGDIGHVGELGTADHYLPKSRFPAYSVLPLNLVPACVVCNGGLGSNFPSAPQFQPLHPYLDDDHFFSEKWIFSHIKETDPVEVDFFVSPPAHWSAVDKSRVRQHFEDCNLASRYRSRVNSEISPLISQRKSTMVALSPDAFRLHLEVVSNEVALPINGWRRALYAGLAASEWFCSQVF